MLVLYTGLPPSAVRDFVVARDAAAIARMYADVAGGPPPLRRLWFAAGPDEPPIHIDARDGDQVVVMALFERAALDAPLPLANTLARRQSERLCEERLAGLQARAGFDGRIRAALARQPGDMPSLESLAERLHMTPRTLRRRLAERGTTYRRLVEEVRRDLACALLHDPELPIQTVAVRLGYEDPASFTTAFRRWVGSSPAQYRRNAGKPS
jgi:AraC-like DNA-binding protein